MYLWKLFFNFSLDIPVQQYCYLYELLDPETKVQRVLYPTAFRYRASSFLSTLSSAYLRIL